jgi:hypothetical protein
MKTKCIIYALLSTSLTCVASDPVCTKLLAETVTAFSISRVPETGLYLDRLSLVSPTNPDVVSISATGVGLLSEVISWKSGSITYAEAVSRWLKTLNTLIENSAIQLSRRNGFYSHFYTKAGYPLSWSEISSADNSILMMTLFWGSEKLQNSEITQKVAAIYSQINWPILCARNSGIYRTLAGDGTPENVSSSFNEYCISAFLSSLAAGKNGFNHLQVLESFYPSKNSSIPRFNYSDLSLLSDGSTWALSSFVPQFSFFFLPQLRDDLVPEIRNFQKADSAWFSVNTKAKSWEYGMSAGAGYPDGYSVDKINGNQNQIVSPSSIAGYIPVANHSVSVLNSMMHNNVGRYKLPGTTSDSILWRYSLIYGNFAKEVQLIDMTGILLGTAYNVLGSDFFNYSIPPIAHPYAVNYNYSDFSRFSNVRDIELAADNSIFIINSDSLWHITGNSYVNIPVPKEQIFDLSVSSTAIYLACFSNLYKIPLSNTSAVQSLDAWSWDPFVFVKSKPGINGADKLLYYIASWGSRSGWLYRSPSPGVALKQISSGGSGYGLFDAESDSTIYIYENGGRRYNLNNFSFTSISETSILASFTVNGTSLLLNDHSYSLDRGTNWAEFQKPYNLPYISPTGFAQINQTTIAFADYSREQIILLKNGKLYPTTLCLRHLMETTYGAPVTGN